MRYLIVPLLFLSAAALAQNAVPESPQPDASPPVQKAAATQDGKDRMICRTEVETGSLIRSRKRCLTAEQWEQLAFQHRKHTLSIQENNAGRGMCPPGASC